MVESFVSIGTTASSHTDSLVEAALEVKCVTRCVRIMQPKQAKMVQLDQLSRNSE